MAPEGWVCSSAVDGVASEGASDGRSARTKQLVEGSEDLVQAALRRLVAEGVSADREDLLAFGRQGLFEAAERYEPERGDFRRFAYLRVRGAMIDGLRKMGDWSRRGYERIHLLRAADAAAESVSADDGDVATLAPDQAAERLRQHMASVATAVALGVFAEAVFDGGEMVPRDASQSAEDLVGDRQLRVLLQGALDELGEPDQSVVRRFYLDGDRLEDIARDLGHTKSWASRVHTRALRALGARLRASGG